MAPKHVAELILSQQDKYLQNVLEGVQQEARSIRIDHKVAQDARDLV